MRFVFKNLPKKKSSPKWKIQQRSYKREDLEKFGKSRKSKSVEKDLPKGEWARFGFSTDMDPEEARQRVKQLNSKKKLEDEARAKFRYLKKLNQEEAVESAFLPKYLVSGFEEKLYKDSDFDNKEDFYQTKIMSHWRACKKVIRELGVDIKDWEDERKQIYRLFRKYKWSLSYCEKLIMLLNKWGRYCSKRQNIFFSDIPFPRSRSREKIVDNYHNSVSRTKESAPLKLKDLINAQLTMREDHYNWMFISLWFGLRPIEVDSLIDGKNKTWKLGKSGEYTVLKVYQSKLTGVSKEKRWKQIPCLFDEQLKALELIKSGEFKRPLVKTIRNHLGESYTTYAGRKGFEQLLHHRGASYEAISSYLGHSSVDRTWKNYRNRERVIITDLKKVS